MSLKKSPHRPGPSRAETERQVVRRHACLEVLRSLDCLHGVPDSELVRLIDHAMLRAFSPGTEVISQYLKNHYLFLAIHGVLQLRIHDKDGHEVLVGILGRGDCLGEGMLFGDLFRNISVITQTKAYLLQLPLTDIRALLSSTPTLATVLRHIYTRRLIESTLARIPIFGRLSPVERTALADLLQTAHFSRGSTIIEQGQPGSALYIIEAGQVVIEQNGETVATLKEGNFFGEISLLMSKPHRATVRAITPTDLLKLPAAEFHRLLAQRPDMEAHLRTIIEERIQESNSMLDNTHRSRQLVTAVNRGLLRGSHLLVRTPELCPPDCRICEEACSDRYGTPRLHLDGTTVGQFDVVDTCRQCSVGAECVEACPENAFEWTDRGALLINDRCTGCGACVSACPYGVISQLPLAPPHNGGPLWALFHKLRQLNARPIIPLESTTPVRRADKCDLCHGHSDLACLSACPTGSLRLVPVEELFPL